MNLKAVLGRLDLVAGGAGLMLVAYALAYALGNTDLMWGFPKIYYAKHIVMVLAAGAAAATLVRGSDGAARRNLLLLMVPLVAALQLATLHWSLPLQAGVFFLACAFFARALDQKRPALAIVLFVALVGIPVLRNEMVFGGEFLMNSYYGRDRLLLGYFHPKEAANAVVVSALAWFMVLERFRVARSLLMAAFGILLFYVQSRNGLLFLVTFLFSNYLYRTFGGRALAWVGFAMMAAAIVVLATYDHASYDELASGRLSLWQSALEFPEHFAPSDRSDLGFLTVHVDNFYVEMYLEGGPLGLFALLAFLFFAGVTSHGRSRNGLFAVPLLLSLCIDAVFDSGMFSTGNVLHVFTWSLIIACWDARPAQRAAVLQQPAGGSLRHGPPFPAMEHGP